MPSSRFAGSVTSPRVDVAIDMGNPLLNITVDGFLKTGTVAAGRVLAEELYHVAKRGSLSKNNIEHSLKRMCKDAAYWGAVGGVYVGLEYGAERVRGTRDWKNALVGGALAGALISVVGNDSKDKIVTNAITGGAIATASKFINYLV